MAHVAITVEGGVVSGDLLEQIAATPQDAQGQRPGDFGVDGRLSDEIQKAFSDALAYWQAYQTRLARGRERSTTVTRETWMLPLLEELGFALTFQRAATIVGGNSYTISHRLGDDPASPPVHIVSSEQELDRRGNDPRSPHHWCRTISIAPIPVDDGNCLSFRPHSGRLLQVAPAARS